MTSDSLPLPLPDAAATHALGRRLGLAARRGDCLFLSGELGAGKTSLTQGLAAGLGVAEPVTSPTFTLLDEHRGRLALAHADLYRLTAPEIATMGLMEAWQEPRGVAVVEWPERLEAARGALDPDEVLHLRLAHAGEGRVLELVHATPEGRRWLDEALARDPGH